MRKNKVVSIGDFLYKISQNAFCFISFHKAQKDFEAIKSFLTLDEARTLYHYLICCHPDYPDLSNNPYPERMLLVDYIKKLLIKYPRGRYL